MRGPGENMIILSTAWDDPSNRGTGFDQPILMALTYGKGRIFHTHAKDTEMKAEVLARSEIGPNLPTK